MCSASWFETPCGLLTMRVYDRAAKQDRHNKTLHPEEPQSGVSKDGRKKILRAAKSLPADALKKSRDLRCCPRGIFAMREVSDAFKHRKIEIGKSLA